MSNVRRVFFILAALPTLASAQSPLSAFDRPFTVPEMTSLPKDLKPFEYKDVGNQIPNYKGNKGGKKGSTLNSSRCRCRPRNRSSTWSSPKGFEVYWWPRIPKSIGPSA